MPAPTPTPVPTPTPTPTAPLKTVNVSSIPALKSALVDNSVDVIVVANGTYHVSPSEPGRLGLALDRLGVVRRLRFDARTRPVTVRAQTRAA